MPENPELFSAANGTIGNNMGPLWGSNSGPLDLEFDALPLGHHIMLQVIIFFFFFFFFAERP